MAKILVIDDEPGIRRLTCHILEGAGHDVSTYEDGRGALARIECDPPDLVITDIFMPEIEGLDVIMRTRKSGSEVPILAISGFFCDGAGYLPMAEKLGATASLKKPFRPDELIAMVSRLLASPPEN